MVGHISGNCKFNSTTCTLNQKWNNDKFQRGCKAYRTCRKGYSWNPGTCVCENVKYLKRIVDASVIMCN